jgi:REP element-mobilizing transposase RayT
MVRGINRAAIFNDDQDRQQFLERLGENVAKAGAVVYAWVLMTNHVHILFKSGAEGISTVMRKQLTWYAQYYNRKHRRTGHLFENRYKSILCDEENYLLALIRYIHLNPVRAGIVTTIQELDRYPWSGHSVVMGKKRQEWMHVSHVLAQFGGRKNAARSAYRTFVAEGMKQGRIPELTGGGLVRSKGGWSKVESARRHGKREEYDERILGGGEFVSAVFSQIEERTRLQLKLRRTGVTLGKIIDQECAASGISIEELKGGGRRRSVCALRGQIAQRGLEELGLSLAEIARKVGVSTSGIARSVKRLEGAKRENKST